MVDDLPLLCGGDSERLSDKEGERGQNEEFGHLGGVVEYKFDSGVCSTKFGLRLTFVRTLSTLGRHE